MRGPKCENDIRSFGNEGVGETFGVSRRSRIRNEATTEMCPWKKNLVMRAEQEMLRWFGHLHRINERKLPKRVPIFMTRLLRIRKRDRTEMEKGRRIQRTFESYGYKSRGTVKRQRK